MACTRKRVSFKVGRGKEPISFMARTGSTCGPRKKPSTAHLKEYKTAFKREAKICAARARSGKGSKFSKKVYTHCIGTGMKTAFKNR